MLFSGIRNIIKLFHQRQTDNCRDTKIGNAEGRD
jgi:hypothetical protein